ncbi:MAG: anaerobic ribonucleoside-triphosphate reductase activating protein [Clostridia bacterium]|jgi:pyruvate formate lyase activating enzyme|nr:anaerobic ribonucleoside-triphosphate reductase activating protein [Clostridia bacterium]MBQ2254217.1 anaerobic ribonucleoside-triphosphate reductase activating protein [Clostridia bacterium]
MQINGFQKLTLLDFPGKVACIVFTPGCNFRCPFCHNASLVTHIDGERIEEEEILSYLKKRQGLLDGVVVTGGEPTLQGDLADFLGKVKALGYAVKLDTNGTSPEKLKTLVEKGLVDYVAMDIKNTAAKYPVTAGCGSAVLGKVEESIDFLLADTVDYEFRTTVTAELHTPQDIGDIAKRIKGAKRYFLQNFIDSGDIVSPGNSPVTPQVMAEMVKTAQDLVGSASAR